MSAPQHLVKTLLHNPKDHSLSITHLPAPSGSQYVRVSVSSTAICSGELLWPEPNALEQPVPGFDVAGTVVSAPPRSSFKPGDEVFALTSFDRSGAAREEQVALESELALKPEALTWDQAASMPLAALTAWQALFVHAGLDEPVLGRDGRVVNEQAPRKRVLITAASGGVGVWLVQFAASVGAYVVATCGPSNVEFVKGLGADEILDYSQIKLKSWVEHDRERRVFDVVVDCKGGEVLQEALGVVKLGGFLNSITLTPHEQTLPEVEGVRTMFFIVAPSGEQLAKIARLIEAGVCKAVVDSVYKFEDWQLAFDRVAGGHPRGKVVLQVAA